jgi:transcriptional regulator with XRE-family HTH domain
MPARSIDPRFAQRMRDLLTDRGETYRSLAAKTFYTKSYIHALAHGNRSPTVEAAERVDDALGGGGELVGYVDGAAARAASLESEHLTELLCGGRADDAAEAAVAGARHLSVAYLSTPPAVALAQAAELRRGAMTVLQRLHRPGNSVDATEVLVAVGRLSGVLAYAALDLGDPAAAHRHAAAAWHCGEQADHNGLRAWVRGTQSLITRFAGDFHTALELARDGHTYADTGATRARLLCGEAQSDANLGLATAARRALTAAEVAYAEADEQDGLFTFSPAKLAYYSGSALIWLDGPEDARRAEAASRHAIELWAAASRDEHSLDDESLAHVYLATSRLQLHDLEAALAALEPILGLPPERRISWLGKRLARVAEILAAPPYQDEPAAVEARDRIRAY